MRRNNNMGMGGRGGGGGPLMTNHLQELELELELLKRKRQLIQQQQNEMLYRPSTRQTASYNPPRQMYENRFDAPPRRDVPHSYTEPPRAAAKRRPVPVWDSAPGARFDEAPGPNKRPRPGPFAAPPHMNNPPFHPPRPAPLPSLLGPSPLMSFNHIPQKSQNPRLRPFHTKFKQNAQPPGQKKPNSSPKKPTPKKPPSAPGAPKEKENFILTADVKPNSKVSGRLEMALGILSKELKAANTGAAQVALFGTPPLARLVRQGLRERLRAAMLGKVVDSVPTILAEYRKAYPPSMDADLLKLAEVDEVDQDQKLAITLLEQADPEVYFKTNMTKLLEVKLDEMFQRAEKSYNNENEPETSVVVDNLPEVKTAPTEESLKVDAEETTVNDVPTDNPPRAQKYVKWMSLLLERKLPALLAQHKGDIIKLLDLDQMFGTTKAAVVMNTTTKNYQFRKTQHNISYSEFMASLIDQPPIFPRNCPYFAKVHASPAMPQHQLMQRFLSQFNPKTIKRCKKIFNLLFLGFDKKEDYDRILKADQSKIGTATLTILGNVSKTEQAVIEIKDEKSKVLDQVLTPQLDGQINDLLSSIKKDEEDANEATNGEKVKKEENETVKDVVLEETEDNDSDVQEVNAEAEVVAIEDDDAAAEEGAGAPPQDAEARPAPATPAKPKAPATPSTIRTRRASRLAQNN